MQIPNADYRASGKERKMKIMVIDDRREELEEAEKAVKDAGHECVAMNPEISFQAILREMQNVDGVITDLMFLPQGFLGKPTDVPPGGLLVIIHALSLLKPVVVCTNCFDKETEGHHGKTISWIHDSYIAPLLYKLKWRLPFGWLEEGPRWNQKVKRVGKDWSKAVDALIQRIK